MKRILESFKNLYKGADVVKTHIWVALMFVIPGMLGATAQFLDKDYKEYMVPVLIATFILSVLTIIPMLFLSGFYLNFINKRLKEPVGVPCFNLDCFIKGVKALPVFIVWTLYVSIPVLIVFSVSCGFGIFLANNKDLLSIVLLILLCFVFILITFLFCVFVSPFVQLVYISYAKNFEYSAKLFNPLVFFTYVKKSFKETMLVVLKFIVVNLITSTVAQILGVVFVILAIAAGLFVTILTDVKTDTVPPLAIIFIILLSSFAGVIQGYITQVTMFAYTDNLIDVYKDKIEEESPSEDEQEQDKDNEVVIDNESQTDIDS